MRQRIAPAGSYVTLPADSTCACRGRAPEAGAMENLGVKC